MASRVARLAAGLPAKLSLKPGDRVALAMKNCPEYYEILFACWHAGLTAVPMNAKLHAKEFAYILENSGAKACFVTPDLAVGGADGIPVDELDELFAEPKRAGRRRARRRRLAVLHQRHHRRAEGRDAHASQHAVPDPRLLRRHRQARPAGRDRCTPAPLSHGSGLYGLPHFAAGAVNVIPESGHFEPAEIFELLEHWPQRCRSSPRRPCSCACSRARAARRRRS